jgi:plasmid stabilization system protein ParE
MKPIWSKEAADDLDAIHEYISRKSSWNAAKQVERIVLRAEHVAASPMRGHPVHEYPESGCVEVHEGKYRIIHRIVDDKFYVVTVIHMLQRLDLDRLR